jgi:hypothetical protein
VVDDLDVLAGGMKDLMTFILHQLEEWIEYGLALRHDDAVFLTGQPDDGFGSRSFRIIRRRSTAEPRQPLANGCEVSGRVMWSWLRYSPESALSPPDNTSMILAHRKRRACHMEISKVL